MIVEKSLIIRLQQQERDALKEIYAHYLPSLYAFIQRMVKSPELTEDVCQDVFIKLWEKSGQIDPERPLQPFLFEIAKNHLLTIIRRSSMEKEIVHEIMQYAELAANTTENAYQFAATRALLHNTVEQLPAQRQLIFRLCKQEELSYAEVASKLQISESTVNNQMVKALKFVKLRLNALFSFL